MDFQKGIDQLVAEAMTTLQRLPSTYAYHSYKHTLEVATMAIAIGIQMNLPGRQIGLIRLAAWYHDLCFSEGAEGHEENAADLLGERMAATGFESSDIGQSRVALLGTRLEADPVSELAEILRDADSAHLSFRNYPLYAENLRRELIELQGARISREQWRNSNIQFFASHRYFTPIARRNFQSGKARNFKKLVEGPKASSYMVSSVGNTWCGKHIRL